MKNFLLVLCLLLGAGCTTPPIVPIFIWRPNLAMGAKATQNAIPDNMSASVAEMVREVTRQELLRQSGEKNLARLSTLPRKIKEKFDFRFWFYAILTGLGVATLLGWIPVKWWLKKIKKGKEQLLSAIEEMRDEGNADHNTILHKHLDEDVRKETGIIK